MCKGVLHSNLIVIVMNKALKLQTIRSFNVQFYSSWKTHNHFITFFFVSLKVEQYHDHI